MIKAFFRRLEMARIAVVIVCVLTLCPGLAPAHTLISPEFRGQDGTNFQEWTLSNDDTPPLPD